MPWKAPFCAAVSKPRLPPLPPNVRRSCPTALLPIFLPHAQTTTPSLYYQQAMGDSWEDDDFTPVLPAAVILPTKAAWEDEDLVRSV